MNNYPRISPKGEFYELLQPVPCCPAGAIFGVTTDGGTRIVLAWGKDGCRQEGCSEGGSIRFPYSATKDSEWFARVKVCPECESVVRAENR